MRLKILMGMDPKFKKKTNYNLNMKTNNQTNKIREFDYNARKKAYEVPGINIFFKNNDIDQPKQYIKQLKNSR